MKHISIFALSAIAAIGFTPCGADAAPISRFQSNGVITNNIAVMQHSIMLNTFGNFGAVYSITDSTFSLSSQTLTPPIAIPSRAY